VVVGERLICARVAPGGPAASGGWASGPPGAVGAGGNACECLAHGEYIGSIVIRPTATRGPTRRAWYRLSDIRQPSTQLGPGRSFASLIN